MSDKIHIETGGEIKYSAPYTSYRHFLRKANGEEFEIVGNELKPVYPERPEVIAQTDTEERSEYKPAPSPEQQQEDR